MNTAPPTLSDYQRGILNELGISCWRLQASGAPEQNTEANLKPAVDPTKTSQENALNRLQQLKSKSVNGAYAQHIVCSFSPASDELEILKDILFTLGIDSHPLVTLDHQEIAQLDDYVCRWDIADKVQLSNKCLLTPALTALQDPARKKQLWAVLQSGNLGFSA